MIERLRRLHFVVIPFLVSLGRNLLTCAGKQSVTLLFANRSSFIRYQMDHILKSIGVKDYHKKLDYVFVFIVTKESSNPFSKQLLVMDLRSWSSLIEMKLMDVCFNWDWIPAGVGVVFTACFCLFINN